MSTSNPLDLPLISEAQNSKHVTHNDAILKLSQALGNRVTVDVSAGNETVLADTAQRNYFFLVSGASVARDVTLPAKNRTLLIQAAAANAEDVTLKITGGTDTVIMPPGSSALVVSTEAETLTGFFLAQTATVDTLLDLSDFPANYSGAAGQYVAVNAGATAVEFVDPPAAGGATVLSDLTDVLVADPVEGFILRYDEGTSKFIGVPEPEFLSGYTPIEIIAAEASRTLVLDDRGGYIRVDVASANTITVPANSAVAFAIGTQIKIEKTGAGQTTLVAGSGVTILSLYSLVLDDQYSSGLLTKVLVDTWVLERTAPEPESASLTVSSEAANHTLVIGDAGTYIRMTSASANTLTIPTNASVAFVTGTQIGVVQAGAGQTTVVAASGVTINTPETLLLRKQYSAVTLTKVAEDTWDLIGDLEATV